MKLSKDNWFRGVLIAGSLLTVGSAIAIGFSGIGKLGVCFKPECFANFLTYYDFPFKAATATVAALGLIAMLHKSKQTAQQITLSTEQIQTTINQNQYLNYFNHLKDFKEQVASVELTALKPMPNHTGYKLIFPKNTPTNFSVEGTTGDLSVYILHTVKACNQYKKAYLYKDTESFITSLVEIKAPKDATVLINYHNRALQRLFSLAWQMGFRQRLECTAVLESSFVPDEIKETFRDETYSIDLPKLSYYAFLFHELCLIINKYSELSISTHSNEIYADEIHENMKSLELTIRTLEICNISIRKWAENIKEGFGITS